MDFIDYREKLGCGFADDNKFRYFLTKMFNFLESMKDQLSYQEYLEFCNCTGSKMNHNFSQEYQGDYRFAHCLEILRNNTHSLQEFLAYYIAFVNVRTTDKNVFYSRETYKKLLVMMLDESHISYDIFEKNDEYFVFPKGAKELDDALISQPLEWLVSYPLTRKAYISALKAYSDANEEQASRIADDFRKALETFCQEFFGGGKSLDNYKPNYCEYLKEKGVPAEISNEFVKLLDLYTKFNNNYAKHHDKTELKVLEYIMYQTGNIIRLLITLKNSDN